MNQSHSAPTHSAPATQFGDLAPHYDELMDVVPYDFWAEYVMTLFHFAGHKARKVLDCACGTGNLSFELAGQKLEVVGVDLSHEMIAQARAKAEGVHFNLRTRFYQGDLAQFDLRERFDAATCLYDSLNYILDPAQLQAAFARIAAHLVPDGVFVFDLNSVFAFEANLFTQSSRNPRKRLHYEWTADFDRQSRICTVNMHFERALANGTVEVFHELHRERAYTREEIEAMLEATGWELLHTFDAYTLNRPHDRSERWFFVARKDNL